MVTIAITFFITALIAAFLVFRGTADLDKIFCADVVLSRASSESDTASSIIAHSSAHAPQEMRKTAPDWVALNPVDEKKVLAEELLDDDEALVMWSGMFPVPTP